MAKKLNMCLVLSVCFCLARAHNVFGFGINDLPPEGQEIAAVAIGNYVACGLTEAEATLQVEIDLNIQAMDQLEEQVETMLYNQPGSSGNRWNISMTDYEKELVSKLVYLEAGNQTDNDSAGKKAVVAVVLNRMLDGRFGGTSVQDVLFTPGQFHTVDSLNRVTESNWKAQIWVVDAVLNGDTTTDGMNYLYFRSDRPRGANDVKIQGHWFSR